MVSKGLVIIVTGANSGLGFSICHRLLIQLSTPDPADAHPYFAHLAAATPEWHMNPADGVTLVLACRSPAKGRVAQAKLLGLLDKHIRTIKGPYREYAKQFRANVRIGVEGLDLASMRSVFEFCGAITDRYDYVSHLILNAGTATYSHLDVPAFTVDFLSHPIDCIEHPRRNIQRNGVLSSDNLGYAWQCNIFSHYVMYRLLEPLMVAFSRRGASHTPVTTARVLWMSSLDAEPLFDPDSDWQLTKTLHSYQASKFQVDLIATELDRRSRERKAHADIAPYDEVRHVLISPGIFASEMSALLNIWIPGWRWLMIAAFALVRLVGSPHVLVSAFKSAVSAVHFALVAPRFIPTTTNSPQYGEALPTAHHPHWHAYHGKRLAPVAHHLRLTSETDRWGRERPGALAVPEWEEHPNAGPVLLERFERLYEAFARREKDREADPLDESSPTDSGYEEGMRG